MNTRRSSWVLGLLLIGACGGGDDDSAPPPPPPPPVLSLTVGTPLTVSVEPVPESVEAETGAAVINFNVAAPGNYRCTAHGTQGAQGRDAQMSIAFNGAELARDDDSGDGFDSMILRPLAAGMHTIRVWEWQRRDAQITVTCVVAPAAPANPTVLTAGAPATVTVQQGPQSRVELNFVVAAPANIQCDAVSTDRDAQLAIVQNGQILQEDSDSGAGFNARITRQLAPGAYVIRVWEWQGRPTQITVRCGPVVPATIVADNGVLTLGAPATVNIPAGDGPAGHIHLNLAITAPGPYTCDAISDGHDAQMAIIEAGNVLAQDSDSGEGTNARLTRDLTPGAYQIRLWEWLHRETQITVTCRAGS